MIAEDSASNARAALEVTGGNPLFVRAVARAMVEGTCSTSCGDGWTASHLAAYGESTIACRWTIRAADEAVRRLAFDEGTRLYRAALALPTTPLAR